MKKLHNPKSHSPAAYIPTWLIQIPSKELSHGAKILYGRLAQWSNATGKVFRSAPNLAKEIGVDTRTVERYIKELKTALLIGTFQNQAGGQNNFEFYDHVWMRAKINDQLCYGDREDPPTDMSVPPDRYVGTPPTDMSVINIKQIKRNKDLKHIPDFANTGDIDAIAYADPQPQKPAKNIADYKKDERFMSFYNEYPKKEDPRDAHKAFKSIVGKNDELLAQIIDDVKTRKVKHDKWQDRQYIKYPAVYLRKGEYLGEIYSAEQAAAEKRQLSDDLAKQREKQQDEAIKQRSARELQEQQLKRTDAQAYRNVIKTAPTALQAAGMKGLKDMLGIKTRSAG